MKGKKVYTEFLSSFIESCVAKNIITTEDILTEARTQIESIEKKIIEAEKLKIIRSKILDVITTFDVSKNPNKINDSKILPLYNISNPNICKFICEKVKNGPVKIILVINDKFSKQDIMFSIKQLLETKVIIRTGELLSRGEMYHNYMKLVLCNE